MPGGPYNSSVTSSVLPGSNGRHHEFRQLYADLVDQLPGDYDDRVERFNPGDTEVAVLKELEGVEDVETIERVMRRHDML